MRGKQDNNKKKGEIGKQCKGADDATFVGERIDEGRRLTETNRESSSARAKQLR